MRRSAVLLIAGMIAGCDAGAPSKGTDAAKAPVTETKPKEEPAALRAQAEAETDTSPPQFDPASGARTVRWIAALTDRLRQFTMTRARGNEERKHVQDALAKCLKQAIHWKVPVQSVGQDGKVLFAPFRLTTFADRSEKHPEITLQVLPWNKTPISPLFDCPPEPWLAAVRGGQDAITLHGIITTITFKDPYIWYVALTDVRVSPENDPKPPPPASGPAATSFAAEDADQAFAWLRQQCYAVLDPSLSPPDREHQKQILHAKLKTLEGTKVRWQWPAVVANDYVVALQPTGMMDYPKQIPVKTGLLVKQARGTGAAKIPAVPGRPEYGAEFVGSAASNVLGPDIAAKIRDAKKATVSGKVSKVLAADYGVFPPLVLEIAVRLDDATIEP